MSSAANDLSLHRTMQDRRQHLYRQRDEGFDVDGGMFGIGVKEMYVSSGFRSPVSGEAH